MLLYFIMLFYSIWSIKLYLVFKTGSSGGRTLLSGIKHQVLITPSKTLTKIFEKGLTKDKNVVKWYMKGDGIVYKLIKDCGMPKWLKILINILLTLTCVYWIGWFVYKFLDLVRIFLHTMTEKKLFFVSLGIMFICAITTLLILEFRTDVRPFTKMFEWFGRVFLIKWCNAKCRTNLKIIAKNFFSIVLNYCNSVKSIYNRKFGIVRLSRQG